MVSDETWRDRLTVVEKCLQVYAIFTLRETMHGVTSPDQLGPSQSGQLGWRLFHFDFRFRTFFYTKKVNVSKISNLMLMVGRYCKINVRTRLIYFDIASSSEYEGLFHFAIFTYHEHK